jgi:hypothetical protein
LIIVGNRVSRGRLGGCNGIQLREQADVEGKRRGRNTRDPYLVSTSVPPCSSRRTGPGPPSRTESAADNVANESANRDNDLEEARQFYAFGSRDKWYLHL